MRTIELRFLLQIEISNEKEKNYCYSNTGVKGVRSPPVVIFINFLGLEGFGHLKDHLGCKVASSNLPPPGHISKIFS
jgi:hypothetical protein